MSRIFVKNLSSKTQENDMHKLFASVGKISDIILKNNFAFIQYESERDAKDAVRTYHNYRLHGNPLIVEFAKTRSEKMHERENEKCFKCNKVGHWAKDCRAEKELQLSDKRTNKHKRR